MSSAPANQRALHFIENTLRVRLRKQQKVMLAFFLATIDGLWKSQFAIGCLKKKFGKTFITACLIAWFNSEEYYGHQYNGAIVANSQKQAYQIMDALRIELTKLGFEDNYDFGGKSSTRIIYKPTGAWIDVIPAEKKSAQGWQGWFFIYDEIGESVDAEVWDIMSKGFKGKPAGRTIGLIISTLPENSDHYYDAIIENGRQGEHIWNEEVINKGKNSRYRTYYIGIGELGDRDPLDPELWRQASPWEYGHWDDERLKTHIEELARIASKDVKGGGMAALVRYELNGYADALGENRLVGPGDMAAWYVEDDWIHADEPQGMVFDGADMYDGVPLLAIAQRPYGSLVELLDYWQPRPDKGLQTSRERLRERILELVRTRIIPWIGFDRNRYGAFWADLDREFDAMAKANWNFRRPELIDINPSLNKVHKGWVQQLRDDMDANRVRWTDHELRHLQETAPLESQLWGKHPNLLARQAGNAVVGSNGLLYKLKKGQFIDSAVCWAPARGLLDLKGLAFSERANIDDFTSEVEGEDAFLDDILGAGDDDFDDFNG